MASINFYLKTPLKLDTLKELQVSYPKLNDDELGLMLKENRKYNKTIENKETIVYLFAHYYDKRIKWSTGEKVKPINWDAAKQRAKRDNSLNKRLNDLDSIVDDILKEFLRAGTIPSTEQVREKLVEATQPAQARQGLVNDYKTYLESIKGKCTAGTMRVKEQLVNYLTKYELIKRTKVEYRNIDEEFYTNFMEFLQTPYSSISKIALNNNTAGKQISQLKSFMRYAVKQNWTDNAIWQDFRVTSNKVDDIYLDKIEILQLHELNLSDRSGLSNARDLFLLGCLTGLRVSDFMQIRPDNFRVHDGMEFIVLTPQKTGEQVSIPLHPLVKAIMARNNGNLPRAISSQKLNQFIKEIGKIAKFDEVTQREYRIGAERMKAGIKKYERIKTHTARRSFATNLYLEGVPPMIIMKITGHKTESSFLRYIKISDAIVVSNVANSDFFKMAPILKQVG